MTDYMPGTVGTSRYGRVFRTPDGWVFDDGSVTSDPAPRDFRPLVAIDPEDRAHAKLIVNRIASQSRLAMPGVASEWDDAVQAALRSLIAPPKPAEPTGLGAVVETSDGRRYVRTIASSIPWLDADDTESGYEYADLNAVRVLSLGVDA